METSAKREWRFNRPDYQLAPAASRASRDDDLRIFFFIHRMRIFYARCQGVEP